MCNITSSGEAMSCGAGRHGGPLSIHHQNSPQCLQVDEVPIEISIAYLGANFSGDLEQVKHHTGEASHNAVLAVCHGYVPDLLYHRTKSYVSAFLKRDGNIELHVSVTFTACGNL